MLRVLELGEAGGTPDQNLFIVLDGDADALRALIEAYKAAEPEPDNRSVEDFALWMKRAGKLPDQIYQFVAIDSQDDFKATFAAPRRMA